MAETDECAQRACLRMADVTVIHSVTTRATGLTATVMGRASRLAIVSARVDATFSSLPVLDMAPVCCYFRRVCDRGGEARRGCRYGRGDMNSYLANSNVADDTHPPKCHCLEMELLGIAQI